MTQFTSCRDMRELRHKLLAEDSFQCMTVRNSQPANWITAQGVWKKRNDLEKRMPDLRYARFITLTLDPKRFDSIEQGYEVAKRHLREFFYRLDKAIGVQSRTQYAWKLEFHENGWPHWHVIFLHRKMISTDVLNECWGKGRTQVEMIKGQGFTYLFKYAAKQVDHIPHCILQKKQVRFFQTSPGFLLAEAEEEQNLSSPDKAAPASPRRVDNTQKEHSRGKTLGTLGERIERWGRTLKFEFQDQILTVESEEGFFAELILETAKQAVHEYSKHGVSQLGITATNITTQRETICQLIRKTSLQAYSSKVA